MSITAERDFGLEREARKEHILQRSVTDKRQSSKSKGPQPVRVASEITRRLCCSSVTALWQGCAFVAPCRRVISEATVILLVF
jgi:hypothetical protein